MKWPEISKKIWNKEQREALDHLGILINTQLKQGGNTKNGNN
jgi:hypothetical protein